MHKHESFTFEIRPKSAMFDEITLEEVKRIYSKIISGQKVGKNDVNLENNIEELFKEHFSREKYNELCKLNNEERVEFTRYYKMQIKKQKDHRVESFTHFDPHDFFKNDIPGIKRALKELMETPQNNLKVFIDTKEIPPNDQNQALIESLSEIFRSKSTKNEENAQIVFESIRELIAQVLKESRMIDVIQKYQNLYTGSNLEIEKVLEDLEALFNKGESKPSEETLKLIVQRITNNKNGLEIESDNNRENAEKLIEIIIRFLVSLAFRDCSVLVSLHFLPNVEDEETPLLEILEEKGFKVLNGNNLKHRVMYTVGLIDFHMKGIRHAYTHPASTTELFELLLKKLLFKN